MEDNSVETRICETCGRELPIEKFMKSPHDGYCKTCSECVKEKKRKSNKEVSVNKLKRYSSGDLLNELKRRGFYWEKMYVVERKEVKFDEV